MPTPSNASAVESPQEQDARFIQHLRESFDADLDVTTDQQKKDELTSIQSSIFTFITLPSTRPSVEPESMQRNLDFIWHTIIEVAKALDKDAAFQEKLISLFLWMKEFDSSYGFSDALQASWEKLLGTGTASQQCNLAAFSAKALHLGIYREALGLTALWFLREALETDDEAKTAALLPAAVVWFSHGRHKLVAFSVSHKTYEDSKSHLVTPGALARAANIDAHGFSMKRWLFWRQRLQELSHSADSAVAKEAKEGFMLMVSSGRELAYDVPGEARFSERLYATLDEELIRSGKESVGTDDIDVVVGWVN
ncbi:hypothetical protein BGZ61DRAFT_592945 [Ilyonectria robusta]|uniref:uncharacterized protein n=1 Tax=Ilyonectria robusta TaxID=1079257 RepID=UPI001E8D364A|nr:uncharacterized protein BGZ61DRAFT_592945 [Ilyonectria robusta]KAH8665517.1 hypothetical protein BGZ61DRAFT_592945 [Ilyonectria robusta]